MVIKILINAYIIYAFAVVFHEMGHVFISVLKKCQIINIVIGSEKMCLQLGILKISPILTGAYVNVNADDIVNMSNVWKCIYFLIGPFNNLALLLCFGNMSNFYSMWLLIVNLCLFIYNINPYNKKTDMYKCIKYVKKSKL